MLRGHSLVAPAPQSEDLFFSEHGHSFFAQKLFDFRPKLEQIYLKTGKWQGYHAYSKFGPDKV